MEKHLIKLTLKRSLAGVDLTIFSPAMEAFFKQAANGETIAVRPGRAEPQASEIAAALIQREAYKYLDNSMRATSYITEKMLGLMASPEFGTLENGLILRNGRFNLSVLRLKGIGEGEGLALHIPGLMLDQEARGWVKMARDFTEKAFSEFGAQKTYSLELKASSSLGGI